MAKKEKPKRIGPSTEVWQEHRSKVFRYFYHIRAAMGEKQQPMPIVTICLSLDGNVVHRGISVCHPNDSPSKKEGKIKSAGWADKAMYYKADQIGMPTTEVIIDRLLACCRSEGHAELLPYLHAATINADFGHYDTKLTGHEKEFLSQHIARAVASKERNKRELPEAVKRAMAVLRRQNV